MCGSSWLTMSPRMVLTDRGRADLRRAEAEAWLFGERR
jgi:hypothetical protein